MIQEERMNDAHANESKIFVFLTEPLADLSDYRQLKNAQAKLNIYEAYYENCQYTYILEFFVKNKSLVTLLEDLKQFNIHETGVYKECALQAL